MRCSGFKCKRYERYLIPRLLRQGVGLLLFFSMRVVFVLLKLLLKTTNWKPFGKKLPNIEGLEVVPEEARKLKVKLLFQSKVVPLAHRGLLIASGVFVLATFLVGMFQKVSLGLGMLVNGAAAVFGLPIGLIVLVLFPIVFVLLSRMV